MVNFFENDKNKYLYTYLTVAPELPVPLNLITIRLPSVNTILKPWKMKN